MLIKMKLPEKSIIPERSYPTRKEMTEIGYAHGRNDMINEVESLNQPLVRGMEIDKQELANIMKEFRKNQPIMKYSMELMAQHIIDNSIRWLKEAV